MPLARMPGIIDRIVPTGSIGDAAGQRERQHADEVHRPDAAAHADRAGGGPGVAGPPRRSSGDSTGNRKSDEGCQDRDRDRRCHQPKIIRAWIGCRGSSRSKTGKKCLSRFSICDRLRLPRATTNALAYRYFWQQWRRIGLKGPTAILRRQRPKRQPNFPLRTGPKSEPRSAAIYVFRAKCSEGHPMQSRAIDACIGRGDPKRGLDHPWADCVDADAETRGVKRRDPRPKPTARTEAPSAPMATSADKAMLPSFAVSYWSVSRRWLRSWPSVRDADEADGPGEELRVRQHRQMRAAADSAEYSCPLYSPRRPLCVANRVPLSAIDEN